MVKLWHSSLILLGLSLIVYQSVTSDIQAQENIQGVLGLNNETSLLGSALQLDSTSRPSACPCYAICDQDEVWMIDGREGHCNPCDLSLLTVQKNELGQWNCSSLEALIGAHSADPSKTTLIYVHGDRTDDYWAFARGMQFYQNIFGSAAEPRKGVRFVIWAWRSEKAQLRPSKDYTTKSSRAQLVGKSLAVFLNQFSDQRMVLVGYSLGCQAFLVGLRDLSCLRATSGGNSGDGYRICLLAPALDGNYVAAQSCQNQGAELVTEADIFDNSADRALKCSRVIGAKNAPGGGRSIQKLASLGSLPLSNISIYDLQNSVGNKHGVAYYSADPILGCRLRQMVDSTNELSSTANAAAEATSASSK